MGLEMLVGLHVVDEEAYQSYRNEITPILENYGGGFGYDFKVSEVLKSQTKDPINRVFTISFPDQGSKDAFFSNAKYLAIRQQHFEKSVTDTTVIATYER
ncbi:MAG: DUF1330 domain-containing protein [Nitrospirales bacterium]